MKTRFLPLFTLCGVVASSGLVARAIEPGPTQPSDTASALPASAAPQFSGRINDVVSLSKSGVDQSIVLAYIKNSPGPFQPSADEIIKLRDIGVSTPVLTAMMERGAQVRDQAQAAAVAAAPEQNTSPSQAPVISETPPSTYEGADYAAAQPASTVTYIGAGDYGYSYPYYYPTYVSGYYSSAFFYPFPCWYGGIYYAHGCYFPHGGFIHDSFHVHDGFHGSHGGDGHGGDSHGGFHTGTSAGGFHGNVNGGVHSGAAGGFHGGTTGSASFHGGFSTGGTHTMPVGGGVRQMPVGGGMHAMPSTGAFHGSVGGGFHGGSSMSFGGGGGGGGMHGGGGGMHR